MLILLFYLFAGIAAFGALSVFWSKNLIYSALSLLLSLLGVAGVYVLAGAEFVATTQLMVYVGGVLVLLLFGVMFTRKKEGESGMKIESTRLGQGGIIALGSILFLAYGISQSPIGNAGNIKDPSWLGDSISLLGIELMTRHLLAFEVIGLLLLVALIGAMNIASGRQE